MCVYCGIVPASRSDQGRVNVPAMKVVRPPTGHIWYSVGAALDWVRQLAPPTYPESPILFQVDLHGIFPYVGTLDALLGALAAEIRSGRWGQAGIVVSTQDPAVRRYVEMRAMAEDVPLYLSESTTNFSLVQAEPAAPVNATERETLRAVMDAGGRASAKEVADRLEIGHTAAANRLGALVERRLLYRQRTPGRRPDLFVDRRAAAVEYGQQNLQATLELEQIQRR